MQKILCIEFLRKIETSAHRIKLEKNDDFGKFFVCSYAPMFLKHRQLTKKRENLTKGHFRRYAEVSILIS
jgi:hypothetical protein